MSVVLHVRVPRRVVERLREMGVDVPEEVRRLLEMRLRQLELERLVEELRGELEGEVEASDSTPLIRGDREEGWSGGGGAGR